jgi:hypothetical protein
MEEQGVNTLHLALGMLSWREREAGAKFCRAPLILIPVELDRSDARERFYLKYTGEELGENVSLAEKLKTFGLRGFPELPDADDLDVAAYFQQVQQAVSGQNDWHVDAEAIALGFFSFAKFLMYRDLDPATWPAVDGILRHGVLQSLLDQHGFSPATSNYRDDSLLDDQLLNRDLPHVVDADSSQTIAILDSLDGHNMVIQGPPGTGKSQTIVNLIAGAIGAGKRVLFVSEKMAALDVVKRRLDHVRLGGACLELHSNRANKKAVIENLRAAALGDRAASPRLRADLNLLADSRDRLNAYCKAVNDPIGSSAETPCSLYGKLLANQATLRGVALPATKLDEAANWSAEDIARRNRLVAQLQDRVARSGIPVNHPFWGSGLTILLPTDRDEIRKLIHAAGAACVSFEQSSQALARTFTVEPPATEQAVDVLLRSARYLVDAPVLLGVNVASPDWLKLEPQIRQALVAGVRHRALHRQYDPLLRPEAWSLDATETRHAIAELGTRWWRLVSPRWRNASKTLASICAIAPPADHASQLALLDAIAEARQCARTVEAANQSCAALLPASWKGVDSDWELITSQVGWVIGAWQGIRQGTLADWCVDPHRIAADRNAAAAQIRAVEATRETWQLAVRNWASKLHIDGALTHQPFAALNARWAAQSEHVDDLHSLVAYNQIAAECDKEQLRPIATLAASWDAAGASLVPFYERARLVALLERAYRERSALAGFDGLRHAHTVAEFRRLDLLHLEYNRASLAARHAQSMPSGGAMGETGILWREFEKRTRFLPIRSLMLKAGHAIQSIKPVFMMSPLSIANYLPPGALTFDLVIFDEASQVKPVDALGAIVRGQQIVVVGDSKQLPPTSFFDSLADQGQDEDDECSEHSAADIESLLGLVCSRGAHQRMLRWHYRSRHESLITVSNHLFYDDRLVVFPSPDRDRTNLGLVYHRMEKAAYERSRSRTNPVEAKTVATAVMEHAKRQIQIPKSEWDTLGVAAFSIPQMEAILNQLELQRRNDPSCEPFFSYPPHEPFFVKNLENVQGDERDVIFISVGYGPTAEGYLAMSFGPLNRPGGERRLNVLISRARKRCEVFTSIHPDDIDASRTSAAGVVALKTFLNYARTGQLDVPAPTGKPADSDFEEQVRLALTQLGHEVHAQVGSAGFSLDLAVVDPAHPGRYLLGIECDGARYHSARSARDRDRLRQTVLEGLGWRIHRIWSTDWFRHPDQELRKLAEAIESAPPPASPPAPPTTDDRRTDDGFVSSVQPTKSAESPSTPYKVATITLRPNDTDLHSMPHSALAELLNQVVIIESPIHCTEAMRRVLNAAGIQRLGSRIQQSFEEAIHFGVDRSLFVKRDDFLWTPGMETAPVRDRSGLPAGSRKIEHVVPQEIRRAILLVVEESYGIIPDDVPGAVCRLLGFTRVTDEFNSVVSGFRDALIQEGTLKMEGVNLVHA